MTSVPDSIASSTTSTASNQGFIPIDRKRRDNINERIQELLTIIPGDFFTEYTKNGVNIDSGSTLNDIKNGSTTPKAKGTGTRDGKPNKGQILTQAVEFITYLQNQIDTNNREEVDLIAKLQELNRKTGVVINDINLENTSAEEMLSKVGVGPLGASNNNDDNGTAFNQSSEMINDGFQKTQSHNFEYGGYSEYGDGT